VMRLRFGLILILDQRKRRPGKARYSMYCRSEKSCRLSVRPQLVIAAMQDERSLLAEENSDSVGRQESECVNSVAAWQRVN
jgi:hypothetical protein